jgi:hypothetical protein
MWSTSNEVAPDPAIGAVKTVGREGDGLIGKTPTLGVVSNCARQDAVSGPNRKRAVVPRSAGRAIATNWRAGGRRRCTGSITP